MVEAKTSSCGRPRTTDISSFLVCVLFLFTVSAVIPKVASGSASCSLDSDCETRLSVKSRCYRGFCTNPFHDGGCLESLVPGWTKKRVCGSDDPPEAVEEGSCRLSPWEDHYMEIRIIGQDWESSWFVSTSPSSDDIDNFLPLLDI